MASQKQIFIKNKSHKYKIYYFDIQIEYSK